MPTLVAALVASAAGWLVESPVRAVAGPIASGATGLVVGTFAFYFARRYIEGLRGGS